VWYLKPDFTVLNNSIKLEIKKRFERERIRIPYTQVHLHSGDQG
jgi:small-conductance mechanosensitive channel